MNEQEANAEHVDILVPLLAEIVNHEEHSHGYHLAILRLPSQVVDKIPQTDHLVEELNKIAGDQQKKEKVRVAALATSLASLWRRCDYKQFRKVFDEYSSTFQEGDSLLELLYKGMYNLSQVSSPGGFERALKSAKRAKEALPDTPAALNLYTEVVSVIGERDKVDDEELEQAKLAIEKAIDKDSKYAKYYANRARVLALQGHYDKAHQDIDKAIEIEDFDEHTLWRANFYEEVRLKIRLQQHSTKINKRADQVRDQLISMRGETLTLLGLLAAVIAFVVSSVQLVSNLTSVETGILMTFMAGLILVVFGAFIELIQPGDRWRRKSLYVVLIGAAIVILAGLVLWVAPISEVVAPMPGLND